MAKRTKVLIPGESYTSLVKAETRKERASLSNRNSAALRGSLYWVMWGAILTGTLATLSFLGVTPGFAIAFGAFPLAFAILFAIIDQFSDGLNFISDYNRAVHEILHDRGPQLRGPRSWLNQNASEVIMEPKYFRALNPLAIVFPQAIAKKHVYEPDKGRHTVVTLYNNGFRTTSTTETYLNDRAVFNRALDKLEKL